MFAIAQFLRCAYREYYPALLSGVLSCLSVFIQQSVPGISVAVLTNILDATQPQADLDFATLTTCANKPHFDNQPSDIVDFKDWRC
jgi:hypothetical protein